MKTLNLIPVIFLFACCSHFSLNGQSFDVSTWKSFVQDSVTIICRDTFFLQTFNTSSSDIWAFTTNGPTEMFDATKAGINNSSEGLSLKLPPGSDLRMDDIPKNDFVKVRIRAVYAAFQLNTGENLIVSSDRGNNPVNNKLWLKPSNNYTAHYAEKKTIGPNPFHSVFIEEDKGFNPENLHLLIQSTGETSSGFYAVDSVYAFRSVPLYLLFDGEHRWDEETFWTKTIPYPHATVLVKGSVAVEKNIQSDRLYLGNGDIHITPNKQLSVNHLLLCDPEISLIAWGELQIKDRLTVNIPFPEKGQWSFISLPFDVYAEEIDTRFELGDDTTTGSGNYFYLQTYNGERRSINKNTHNNWDVVPASVMRKNEPGIKKHTGYLIALDALAGHTDLQFSIPAGKIPADFGKATAVSIDIHNKNNTEHDGWYLCGNPLPAPLLLDHIASNPDLDGHIYVYDGTGYVDYPIGSKFAIPPFGAFFVKASRDTELFVDIAPLSEEYALLSSFSSLRSDQPEPVIANTSVFDFQHRHIRSYIHASSLYLDHMPGAGTVSVFGMDGKMISSQPIPAGSSSVLLNVGAGIYVITISAGSYQAQHKLVQTQF